MDLANRLQTDLAKEGHGAWLDSQRILGGASWTKDIETALDEAHVVLALLTAGSFASEICRAEQLRSLRKGKCVIPLLAQRGVDIPLYLESKNYRDFSTTDAYCHSWPDLLKDIQSTNGVALRPEYRQTYVTAPPIPPNFVERPEALKALRNALITDGVGRNIALTAFAGMGGIGKTVLAQVLCHDDVVQNAFPDGVIWVSAGKESGFDLVTRLRELGKALNDDLSRYDNELGCRNQYRSTIRTKAALVVVDDVWHAHDLEPLLAESPRSRLLFTTRNSSIASAVGADEHTADLLTESQSRAVFMQWAGMNASEAPLYAPDIIRECGRLPLALSMVGAMLRGKPPAIWKRVLDSLRSADLEKIRVQFPYYPHPTLFRAIQISVDDLEPIPRQRYLALGVLLEEMAAHPSIQQTLWSCDEADAVDTSEQFLSLSLAQRDRQPGSIRLHDLQLDYVRAQYPDTEALRLIRGAVRLSSHVIARDPNQFASQVVGRLLGHTQQSTIASFSETLKNSVPQPWLMPLRPVLDGPASGLIRTLEGHSNSLNAVAITVDGRRAISASKDKTLKVWDIETGQALWTLKGHLKSVNDVTVTPNGKYIVSASDDHTLRVWSLETGKYLRSLKGHQGPVNAVAAFPNGEHVISASDDTTLKLWNLKTGRVLSTQVGHSKAVLAIAVFPDGKSVISASEDQTLRGWSLPSFRKLFRLEGHMGAVNDVVISYDGQHAISASSDDTIRVWNLALRSEIRKFNAKSRYVWGISQDQTSSRLVSASENNTIKIWNLDGTGDVRVLRGHSRAVHDVEFSADGNIVSASYDDTVKVWDPDAAVECSLPEGHLSAIYGIAVSKDGGKAITVSRDGEPGSVKSWDLTNGREIFSVEGLFSPVYDVAMRGDGRIGILALWDKTLQIWNLETRSKLRILRGHSQCVSCVAMTSDGYRIVSGSWDKTLRVWDGVTGRHIRTLKGHGHCVNTVAIDQEGRWAVSGSEDETLRVWDLETGRILHTLKGHSGAVRKVAVAPGFQIAVSASQDKRLKLWDLKTGYCLRTFDGHVNAVNGAAISSDGRWAVSASLDHTLRVWDLHTGVNSAAFTMDSAAYSCVFSQSRHIISGDGAGQLHVLRLEGPPELIDDSCANLQA